MKRLGSSQIVGFVFAFCLAAVTAASAQYEAAIYSFCSQPSCSTFYGPSGQLTQATDGNFYGVTGGSYLDSDKGSVFKITPMGELTTLYTFCSQGGCPDGANPVGRLVQGADGNLYGLTQTGGVSNTLCFYGSCGTTFRITLDGTLTTLYTFCSQADCADGANPSAGLVQGSDGSFYGTTLFGGTAAYCTDSGGCGSVFKITPEGTLTTLYAFCVQTGCTDGSGPEAALVQGNDGDFYGTAAGGGANDNGTIFKITPSGTLTTLYSFCPQYGCPDGYLPHEALIQATDGNLYGTSSPAVNIPCSQAPCGIVFKITPAGVFTTLYNFCSLRRCSDGEFPQSALVQGGDGNLYGTTLAGGGVGVSSGGTIFKITTGGALTTLYKFCSLFFCADGGAPPFGLAPSSDGNFYGTTMAGGATGYGAVFGFYVVPGTDPFVELQPSYGKVRTKVSIVGNLLTSATSVSFNGTPAKFMLSKTGLVTNVPAGATTGSVTVTTPSATLVSNVPFKVVPRITKFKPKSGPVGTVVQITGVSLTQTTGVAFGGVAATVFSVNSDTQVTATVPNGAVTGPITIITLGGSASKGRFTVD
jgi:uncharacterized repeat protein (TIGR03803 family)